MQPTALLSASAASSSSAATVVVDQARQRVRAAEQHGAGDGLAQPRAVRQAVHHAREERPDDRRHQRADAERERAAGGAPQRVRSISGRPTPHPGRSSSWLPPAATRRDRPAGARRGLRCFAAEAARIGFRAAHRASAALRKQLGRAGRAETERAVTDWIQSLMQDLGYAGIVLLMTLENVFPPIPSEVVMPFAGYTSANGDLHIVGVILAGTLGSVLGALPLYYIGVAVGQERLEAWAKRHGAWLTLSAKEVRRAHRWFEEHGTKTVFLCRFVPGVRSLISIPAGVVRMPMWRFLLWTALGTGIWAGGLAWIGRALGSNYDQVERYVDPILYVVIGVFVIWYVARLVQQRRRRHA
jgi:membrane protein DedA with SNARE-associated domain